MIYEMLFILIVFFLVGYVITKDLFSPACIICESYIISIIFGCINSKLQKWEFSISSKTVGICLIGIAVFEMVFLIFNSKLKVNVNLRINKGIQKLKKPSETEAYNIELDKTKILFLLIFQLFVLVIYIYFFSRNVGNLHLKYISNTMMTYRTSYYFDGSDNSLIPGFVKQLTKLSRVVAYVCIYIYISNNIRKKQSSKRNNLLLVPCALYIPIVLLSGGRYYIIMYFISSFMIWITLNKILENKQLSLKNFIKILLIVISIFVFFSVTRTMVGRNSQSGLLEYVTGYLGKSLKVFDLYLEDPVSKSHIWGKETFYSLNRFFYKLGLIKDQYTIYLEFRTLDGIPMGNTYTSFRCMYQDFGILGIIILQGIEGMIFAVMYKKVLAKKECGYSILLLMYSMMISTLFMHSYSEGFFNEVISLSYIVFLVGFVCCGFYLRIHKGRIGTIKIRRTI